MSTTDLSRPNARQRTWASIGASAGLAHALGTAPVRRSGAGSAGLGQRQLESVSSALSRAAPTTRATMAGGRRAADLLRPERIHYHRGRRRRQRRRGLSPPRHRRPGQQDRRRRQRFLPGRRPRRDDPILCLRRYDAPRRQRQLAESHRPGRRRACGQRGSGSGAHAHHRGGRRLPGRALRVSPGRCSHRLHVRRGDWRLALFPPHRRDRLRRRSRVQRSLPGADAHRSPALAG